MKILEAQNAALTNFEVYQHISGQQAKYKKNKRRGPVNHGQIVRAILEYFESISSPFAEKPCPYTPESIAQLVTRLQEYELSKGEMLMILNLRPTSIPALTVIVEDITERFTEEQYQDMLVGVSEVLGPFEDAAPAEGDGDTSMENAA